MKVHLFSFEKQSERYMVLGFFSLSPKENVLIPPSSFFPPRFKNNSKLIAFHQSWILDVTISLPNGSITQDVFLSWMILQND